MGDMAAPPNRINVPIMFSGTMRVESFLPESACVWAETPSSQFRHPGEGCGEARNSQYDLIVSPDAPARSRPSPGYRTRRSKLPPIGTRLRRTKLAYQPPTWRRLMSGE